MDFESCFTDCCKTCTSAYHRHKAPMTGQGDCKCSTEVTPEQNSWINANRGKKLKNRGGRDKTKDNVKAERQKKSLDIHCNCCTRSNKKPDCELEERNTNLGNLRHDTKEEKKTSEVFDTCSGSFNNFSSQEYRSKMEKKHPPEEPKFLENFIELEEKVDLLLRVFKDCKIPSEGFPSQDQIKSSNSEFGEVWHNLNQRMCAAEESIKKLAMIMEELLKNSPRKRDSLLAEDTTHSNLDFEEMTLAERINFLKNRNDLLLSFMKIFLKVGSLEELFPKRVTAPKKEDSLSQPSLGSKLRYVDSSQTQELTREEIMSTLKKLRVQANEMQQSYSVTETQQMNRCEREDNGFKYPGNKLEVISEQGEFVLNRNEEEKMMDEFKRKTGVRNLKGKFSQVSEENGEMELGLCDTTSKLLAQEAMLKSSLDKVHYELFSKLDSGERNFLKANLGIINHIPSKEGNATFEMDSNFDSLTDVSCIFCENENAELSMLNDTARTSSKHPRQEEFLVPKQEENILSLEVVPLNENNEPMTCGRRIEQKSEGKKNKYSRKVAQNGALMVETPQRTNRNGTCIPELCSSKFERSAVEISRRDQRPLTAPTSERRSPYSSGLQKSPSRNCVKSMVQGNGTKKNSGINNNVRNTNKILLNKKSFARTS